MELIGLYYGVISATQEIQILYGGGVTIPSIFYYGLIGVAIWAALFALQGFGLRAMAMRRNIKKTWRAFVPFVNILLMGELAGTCRFFNAPIKRAGLLAMIFQIVATAVLATHMMAQIYLYVNHGVPQITQTGMEYWPNLSGTSLTMYKLYDILGYFASLAQVVCEVMFFILLIGLYKNYNYKNHMILGVLSLFIPVSRMIVIFVLRNNKYVDYDALMRARREAYIRQQQQYQQGGFGAPYGNPNGNPYGRTSQQPTPPDQGDPFDEFGASNNSANGNASGGNAEDVFDDIFN